MIKRLNLACSKLFFCLRITADWSSFFKLVWNTKRLKRHKKYQTKFTGNDPALCYNVKINSKKYKIHLRTFKGDIDIFYEIFWKEVYKLPESSGIANGVFLDAGANIGMATLYFKAFYNPALIISIEPAIDNYTLLVKNTEGFDSIKTVNAAVMAKDGWVSIKEEFLHYNNKAAITNQGGIKATTFNSLCQQFNILAADVLKIDIEGAEEEIFLNDSSFLANIKNVVIEIHTAEETSICLNVLKEHAFTVTKTKNNFDTDTIFWAQHC